MDSWRCQLFDQTRSMPVRNRVLCHAFIDRLCATGSASAPCKWRSTGRASGTPQYTTDNALVQDCADEPPVWQVDRWILFVAGFARNRNKSANFAEICCADFGEVGLLRESLDQQTAGTRWRMMDRNLLTKPRFPTFAEQRHCSCIQSVLRRDRPVERSLQTKSFHHFV